MSVMDRSLGRQSKTSDLKDTDFRHDEDSVDRSRIDSKAEADLQQLAGDFLVKALKIQDPSYIFKDYTQPNKLADAVRLGLFELNTITAEEYSDFVDKVLVHLGKVNGAGKREDRARGRKIQYGFDSDEVYPSRGKLWYFDKFIYDYSVDISNDLRERQ